MEHLSLEIFDIATSGTKNPTGSKFAVLPSNTSITITETSEIFASGDVWSHSFTLNVYANAHIFGTAGDMHGSRLHEQINKRRARLWVEGIPLYLGYLKLDDEAEVDREGNVDVSFESGQKTFEEMIDGAKANQVPMMGNVRFGVALWTKRKIEMETQVKITFPVTGKTDVGAFHRGPYKLQDNAEGIITFHHTADGEKDGEAAQEYPRMVFPKGSFQDLSTGLDVDIDCLNTDYPYDEGHPYCNVALCYQKYGYLKKDDSGLEYNDYTSDPEAQRGYEYMPANRVNSAPNFYVIYWIKALMKHLGIYIEENQMMDVEDLRRLFFVNTNCAYKVPKIVRGDNYDREFGRYKFVWETGEGTVTRRRRYIAEQEVQNNNAEDVIGASFDRIEIGEPQIGYLPDPSPIYDIQRGKPAAKGVSSIQVSTTYEEDNSYLHDAYATSECFPNADISEVIKAIENGFGVRFLFSDSFQRVRIVLLRNIFNSKDVQTISCEIHSESKTENNIRGFRMTYGNTEDTAFYYKGFADKLPHKKPYFVDDSDKHDYSHWDLDAAYDNIIKKVSAFDKTCYVTPNTGDAYGIKIDKDAKRYKDMHPSLFEFAAFMDAEDGDCSGDEESIHEISMGFTPAIMNDLNMEDERKGNLQQRFALFLDEKMRPRRPDLKDLPNEDQPGVKSYNDSNAVYSLAKMEEQYGPGSNDKMTGEDGVVKPGEFAITSDTYFEKANIDTTIPCTLYIQTRNATGWPDDTYLAVIQYPVSCDISGYVLEGFRLYLQDNFEPTDEGISPIESHDWGLTLGIMRGSGSDATVAYEKDNEDRDEGEYQNDTWEIIPGSSATAHPDTCDSYGNEWDYRGSRQATPQEAGTLYTELFPDANATFADVKSVGVDIFTIKNSDGKVYHALMTTPYPPSVPMYERRFRMYVDYLSGHTDEEIMQMDAAGYMDYQNTIVELDSSYERCDTCRELRRLALGYTTEITIDEGGVASKYGRFSLKLRAEKPNPYYVLSLPDIVRTRQEAAVAIEKLYTTSDTNLLARPSADYAAMREAGWDLQGDGDARTFTISLGVICSDGKIHHILWSPILEDGRIIPPTLLASYVDGLNGSSVGDIKERDTYHLALDIDTTEQRKEALQGLMAIYYAEEGEPMPAVDISAINRRYLTIDDENLRGRGLCDTFYKEYSYWMRNARIAGRTVSMGLAELLAIDRTKKVNVGDITGFIRKMQYSVSNQTGLGEVTMEIMYI